MSKNNEFKNYQIQVSIFLQEYEMLVNTPHTKE